MTNKINFQPGQRFRIANRRFYRKSIFEVTSILPDGKTLCCKDLKELIVLNSLPAKEVAA